MTDFISKDARKVGISRRGICQVQYRKKDRGGSILVFTVLQKSVKFFRMFHKLRKGDSKTRNVQENSFQYEKLCIKTRFEKEVTGTREWLILCFPGQRRPIRQMRSLSQENVELIKIDRIRKTHRAIEILLMRQIKILISEKEIAKWTLFHL